MPGAGKYPPTMQRVDGPGSVNGMFVGGNPTIGVDGTVVTAPWANDVQEEIAAVIEGEGIALATGVRDQLVTAIRSMLYRLTSARLAFTAGANLTAGDPLLLVDTFGVVEASVLTGQPAAILRRGTYSLPKTTGEAWAIGQALYWNAGTSKLTTTAAGNRAVASAAAAVLAAGTSGAAQLGNPNL